MEAANQLKLRAIKISFWVGIVLMAIKFGAYLITDSVAILTDALESIINVSAGAFAWFSLQLAAKPKDKEHPYGHGKIEFISAGFEGGLVLMAALYIFYEAFLSFLAPKPIYSLNIGIILASFAGLINWLLGKKLVSTGKIHHSPTLIADGKHLLTDTWSSLALVTGLGLVYLSGWWWLDPLISCLLGIGIAWTGIGLMRSALAGLMDEADAEKLDEIAAVLQKNRRDNWIDIHNMRLVKYGSQLHVDAHLTLPFYVNLEAAHKEVTAVEDLIANEFHKEVELFIHADPCIKTSCSICSVNSCEFRKENFRQQVVWEASNLIENNKHSGLLISKKN